MDCQDTGQDGAVKKIRRMEGPVRFGVTNDIVQDKSTGLVWHKDADLAGFPLTWKEAFEFIQEINDSRLSGVNAWRLPARKELFSLLSHQFVNPALPKGHPFINVFHGYYWTLTESARLLNQAWYVHLGGVEIATASPLRQEKLILTHGAYFHIRTIMLLKIKVSFLQAYNNFRHPTINF